MYLSVSHSAWSVAELRNLKTPQLRLGVPCAECV